MLKSYCQSCGALTTYASAKPNFCQKCGQAFVGSAKASSKSKSKKRKKTPTRSKKPEIVTEEEGERSQGLYKNLNEIDIEIDVNKNVDTFESIWGTSMGSGGSWTSPSKKKVSEKQFLEQFQKEAGTIRPNKEQETQ